MAIHASKIQIIHNIHNELDELLEIYFEFNFNLTSYFGRVNGV